MRIKACLWLIAATLMALGPNRICEAAHFRITGTSSIHAPVSLSLTQYQWCNFTYQSLTDGSTTIDPDGAERVGDPVTISTCVSGSGSTSVPSSRYVTVGGIGDASSFQVACLPSPSYTPSSGPGTLILNPGAGQTTMISYGPQLISGNQSVPPVHQCSIVEGRIGDVLQGNFAVFALLYDTQYAGPDPDSGGTASFDFTFDASLWTAATGIPTLSEWGVIVLSTLLALAALAFIGRRNFSG